MNDSLYIANISYKIENMIKNNEKINNYILSLKNNNQFPKYLEYIDSFLAENGLSGCAFINLNTNEIIIGFAGTNFEKIDILDNFSLEKLTKYQNAISEGIKDLEIDYNILFKKLDYKKYIKPAIKFIEKLEKNNLKINLITGHSLGGAIADYIGTFKNINVITYNSAPLFFENENNKIKEEYIFNLKKYNQKKYRFRSENDVLNNVSNLLGAVYNGKEIIFKNCGIHFLEDFFNQELFKYYDYILNTDFNKLNNKIIIDINEK